MSVGKASIARAVNAEKASKTETKTEVKEAEVKAAEKPSEVKAETAEKAAEKTTAKKTAAIRGFPQCYTALRRGGYGVACCVWRNCIPSCTIANY